MACLLLSLESVYKPARQLALDMMTRLGTATDEMIEIFLSEGKLVSALSLGKTQKKDTGLPGRLLVRNLLYFFKGPYILSNSTPNSRTQPIYICSE